MKNYTLTPAGVSEWLADFYASTSTAQLEEKLRINSDFIAWLQTRFNLSPSQTDYAHSLNLGFLISLRDEILQSLDSGHEIVLSKAVPASGGDRPPADSVKVTEYEKEGSDSDDSTPSLLVTSPHAEPRNYQSRLEIRIYYRKE